MQWGDVSKWHASGRGRASSKGHVGGPLEDERELRASLAMLPKSDLPYFLFG
jgi:hypothetical protein